MRDRLRGCNGRHFSLSIQLFLPVVALAAPEPGHLMDNIDLRKLSSGLGVITPQLGSALAQAGGVCLEREGQKQSASARGRSIQATDLLLP